MTKQEFHSYYVAKMSTTFTVDGNEYNLVDLGWDITYGHTKRSLGRCVYSRRSKRTRKVEISKHYLNAPGQNMDTMMDCVLHEIAHAIDVEQRGYSNHDHNWKRIASQVGADPTRTTDACESPKGRYTLKCETCGHESQAYKQHKVKKACGKCCKANGGGFQEKYVMIQIDNHTGEEVGYAPRTQRRRSDINWFDL